MKGVWAAVATSCVAAAAVAGPFDDPGHDATSMVAWADDVVSLVRGPLDILDPGGDLATFGSAANALGPATSDPFDVVSLGDGGTITLHFDSGIADGSGDDFAVFENTFATLGGVFAEFAFVEVSSNGSDFVRFDSTSLQAGAVPGGGIVDPTDYDNLAGDQVQPLGTGFDLAELTGDPLVVAGTVDLANIAYVRLVDVIGNGSTFDGLGQPLYDPYPTPFASGGFDVEAVGVIHPVPEPGSVLGLACGASLLAGIARRRSRRRCAAD